jgi:hypothetical protein
MDFGQDDKTNGVVIYTCLMGDNGDDVSRPLGFKPVMSARTLKYVLITDKLVPGTVQGDYTNWEVRRPIYEHVNPRRTARYHKMFPHQLFAGAICSIWFDASLSMNPDTNPLEMLDFLGENDIAVFKHPQRSCVYSEATACARLRKDDPNLMTAQMDRYKNEDYPPFNGLVETGCLVRMHTARSAQFCQAWWNEIVHGSARDQLSFNYISWRWGIDYSIIPGAGHASKWFTYQRRTKTKR